MEMMTKTMLTSVLTKTYVIMICIEYDGMPFFICDEPLFPFRRAQLFDVSRFEVGDAASYCNGLTKLNRRQLSFCLKKPKIVKVLEDGFKQGINTCVEKFKNNSYTRWNCTNIAKPSKSNVFFGIPLAVGMLLSIIPRFTIGVG